MFSSKLLSSLIPLTAASAAFAEVPEFPPIPAIVVPDFIGVEPLQKGFEDALADKLAAIDGIRIAPARCGENGAVVPSLGMVLRDDSGMTANLGEGGTYLIENGGAGVANVGDVRVIVEDDGSGIINREDEQVTVEADGSGTYNGPAGQIILDGNGGGSWNSERLGQISIEADGSGIWNGPRGQIINNGDGSGSVGTEDVTMEPLAPVPPAGKFPLLTKFQIPPAACGYLITLDDSILFDFDKSDLRPDAAATVDALAEAFVQVGPERLEVRGHTDSKGSDDYNQDLSERRAATVAAALKERSVASEIAAQGFGESQPVAQNELDGKDNPAGRQLNRRVEIYVQN